ncbi:MAG TPA: TlpA disulfide reductase family protein [Candidatus Nitrosotenuis sp.]|nr:TlpA disulfide reductase family protein [Candidatus Nitrosotenuis sp.]
MLGAVAEAAPGQAAAEPEVATELVLRDQHGTAVRLSDLRGKIVVLNFWATWCVPCREEMPMLEKLFREFAERGVIVIGASADDEKTQSKIAPFVKKSKVTFSIWLGATTQHMEALNLGTALPATAVLDREGRIVGRILGPLEEADLRRRIMWLLGERQGDAPPAVLNTFEKAMDKHEEDENHQHGGVSVEGASTVPS